MCKNAGTLIGDLIPTQVQVNQLFKSAGLRPVGNVFISQKIATKIEDTKLGNHRAVWKPGYFLLPHLIHFQVHESKVQQGLGFHKAQGSKIGNLIIDQFYRFKVWKIF